MAQNQQLQQQIQVLRQQFQQFQQQFGNALQNLGEQIQREFNLPRSTIKDKSCPVCLEALEPGMLTRTPCWHIYHEQCLIDSRKVNARCAVCRTVIVKGCSRIFVLDS